VWFFLIFEKREKDHNNSNLLFSLQSNTKIRNFLSLLGDQTPPQFSPRSSTMSSNSSNISSTFFSLFKKKDQGEGKVLFLKWEIMWNIIERDIWNILIFLSLFFKYLKIKGEEEEEEENVYQDSRHVCHLRTCAEEIMDGQLDENRLWHTKYHSSHSSSSHIHLSIYLFSSHIYHFHFNSFFRYNSLNEGGGGGRGNNNSQEKSSKTGLCWCPFQQLNFIHFSSSKNSFFSHFHSSTIHFSIHFSLQTARSARNKGGGGGGRWNKSSNSSSNNQQSSQSKSNEPIVMSGGLIVDFFDRIHFWAKTHLCYSFITLSFSLFLFHSFIHLIFKSLKIEFWISSIFQGGWLCLWLGVFPSQNYDIYMNLCMREIRRLFVVGQV